MLTSYKRISMSSRATNIIKQSKRIVLFNRTYWCTPKLYARGVACGKSSHVTRKIEEKLKFQVLWKCNEYEYFVPFFVNHNRSQWKCTIHTFNSFECFIIFVRAFWRAHIFCYNYLIFEICLRFHIISIKFRNIRVSCRFP